jgi:hypothetical protein
MYSQDSATGSYPEPDAIVVEKLNKMKTDS